MKNDIDKKRLELDRKQEEIEKNKVKVGQKFTNKYLGTIITAIISLAALIISATQVYIAFINKDKEISLTQLQLDREWKLKSVEYVSENWNKIFGDDEDERNRIRDIMIVTFPEDITNALFKKLEETEDSETGKKTWQVGGQKLARIYANKIRVFLQYKESKDATVLDALSSDLINAGFNVPGKEIAAGETEGDVRFFHAEDEIYAYYVKELIMSSLKKLDIIQDIKVINLGKKFKNVPRGDIEVWLPPLKSN